MKTIEEHCDHFLTTGATCGSPLVGRPHAELTGVRVWSRCEREQQHAVPMRLVNTANARGAA